MLVLVLMTTSDVPVASRSTSIPFAQAGNSTGEGTNRDRAVGGENRLSSNLTEQHFAFTSVGRCEEGGDNERERRCSRRREE